MIGLRIPKEGGMSGSEAKIGIEDAAEARDQARSSWSVTRGYSNASPRA